MDEVLVDVDASSGGAKICLYEEGTLKVGMGHGGDGMMLIRTKCVCLVLDGRCGCRGEYIVNVDRAIYYDDTMKRRRRK